MEPISVERLQFVHPRLAELVQQVDRTLLAEGIVIRVVQGLRTLQEQNALYAQGRNLPGPIVTKAPGGYSAHNYGYAVDLIPGLRPARDPDITRPWMPNWNSSSPDFLRMIVVAMQCGLVAGARWATFPDPPHFQLPELPVTPTDAMRAVLLDGGVRTFWEHFIPPVTAPGDTRESIQSV